MAWFFLCVALLLGGYFIYGTIVEKIFGIQEDRQTPAVKLADGVDFVPMSTPKVYLVQLLNIAGLGPILGPILGALYGPVAMLWIVIGCIFAGAVHDYFSGMLSIRADGASIPGVVGRQLGGWATHFMNLFAIILLVLVGVVFVAGPAKLLTNMTPLSLNMWLAIIFCYYLLATVVPVDKIIGRLYPIFGALLLFMSIGLIVGLIMSDHGFYSQGLSWEQFTSNLHPKDKPLWPLLFITISCGALSGFHATQSPLMARCITTEKDGKFAFYGSMIGEGIIALIWCTLGLSFYEDGHALQATITTGGSAMAVVNEVANSLLGTFGGVLAVIGVIILPITSGDTAFRSARLIVADFLKMDQKPLARRLVVAVPLFAIGVVLTQVDFSIIWRYFGWANQTVATFMLWAGAAWLYKRSKFHWICTIPAIFMTAVVTTFLAWAEIGIHLPMPTARIIGIAVAVIVAGLFFACYKPQSGENPDAAA